MNIKDLKEVIDVRVVLSKYPLQEIEEEEDEIKFICPWHEEKKPSLFVNQRLKIFHCFGCGEKGSIIDFVAKMEGISFKQAVDKMSSMFNIEVVADSTLRKGEKETIQWLIENRKAKRANFRGDEAFVNRARSDSGKIRDTYFWKDRQFSDDVIDFFELGFYKGRLVIPIRDIKGTLLGHSTRALHQCTGKERFDDRFLHQKGFPKADHLYNFNNVGKLLIDGQCDMLMLVEGFSDVWRAFSNGFLKCVAVMGSEVSDAQIETILRYTYRVCLAFDNDDTGAGKKGMENFWRKTKNLIEIDWMKIPKGLDVGGLGRDDFWKLYNERVSI